MGILIPLQALSAEAAARMIRAISAAKNEAGRVWYSPGARLEMQRLLVSHLQVVLCCRQAAVTHRPVIDNHGNTNVTFSAFYAGEVLHIKLVIEGDLTRGLNLTVIEVAREFWSV